MTIEFGPEQEQLLERLAKSYGMTKTAVVRSGLALFVVAHTEARRGNAIGVVHGQQIVKQISGAWDLAEVSA